MTTRTLHLAGRREESADPGVQAVLEVLGGRPRPEVARCWAVDAGVLHRWVRDFVSAGSAQATHQPDPDSARQRDRFLATFAHELRTPLATARGGAAMLVDGDVPTDAVEACVRRLHDALESLCSRTLDVEMLAAASLGRLTPHPREVYVADLAADLQSVPGPRRSIACRARRPRVAARGRPHAHRAHPA